MHQTQQYPAQVPIAAKETLKKELSYSMAFDDLELASREREEVTRRRRLIREIKGFTRQFNKFKTLKDSQLWEQVKELQRSYYHLMSIEVDDL